MGWRTRSVGRNGWSDQARHRRERVQRLVPLGSTTSASIWDSASQMSLVSPLFLIVLHTPVIALGRCTQETVMLKARLFISSSTT